MSDPRTDPRYSNSRQPYEGPPRPLDVEPSTGSGTMWTGVVVIIIAVIVVIGLAIQYNRTEQASNPPNPPTTTGSAPSQSQPATPAPPAAPAKPDGNASPTAPAPAPSQGPR